MENPTGSDLTLDTAFIDFPTTLPSQQDFADDFLATLGIIPAGGYSGPLFYVDLLPEPDRANPGKAFSHSALSSRATHYS